MIRAGEIVRAELHGHLDGLIAVIAAEINTREGHLEILPAEQSNDAKLDEFAKALPKFDEGKISAINAAIEMYERFGAIPIIVHPHPGIGGIFVHGMSLKHADDLVVELREANITVPIGIERYSSQTDKFLFPFQRRRQAQIDQKIKELKIFGVGETASGDEHDDALGWAYVEFRTKYDIYDADSFLRSFGEALVADDPMFATRAVVNRTIQSYDEWWEALKQMVVVHGIPRIERMAWRKRIQEKVIQLKSQQSDRKEPSFADVYHQILTSAPKLQPILS